MIGHKTQLRILIQMSPSFNNIYVLAAILLVSVSPQPQPVWTDNCISVSSTGTCLTCIQGFYLEYFLCLPCAPLCICSLKNNYCESCQIIQYKNTTYTLQTYLKQEEGRCYFCNAFIDYCLSCSSANTCTSCFGGFYPVNQTSPKGVVVSAICSSSKCLLNCSICANSSACALCAPGFYLDSLKQCTSQCGADCIQCLNQSSCKVCNISFFLNDLNECENCSIANCARCANTSYCDNCQIGYYASDGNCTETGVSNCIVYLGGEQQATGCQICQPGYFVLYSACFQCVGCQLCSLQFLCSSKCYSNATPFNYACLVSNSGSHIRYFMLAIAFLMILQ